MASVYHVGNKLTIWITDDAVESITHLACVHRKLITKELARADKLARMLGDFGRLSSSDQFRNEGDAFWAIRAGHVRLYGWYEPDAVFVISHAISKRHDKLEIADKNRMIKNQAAYREAKGKK
jgi:hypothetical protein